jgi:hypothetical protein
LNLNHFIITSGEKREKVTVTAFYEAAREILILINIVEIQKIQIFFDGLPLRLDMYIIDNLNILERNKTILFKIYFLKKRLFDKIILQ